jgi:predicted amidohydrolase
MMRVVGVQSEAVWEDKEASCRKVEELLRPITIPPGALVVLPEMFATGFTMNAGAVAETPGTGGQAYLARLAKRLSCHVIGGIVARGTGGKGRNEGVVFNPAGIETARFTKLHPFSFSGENEHYEAGEHLTFFHCEGFRVCLFICYDLRFPESFRAAAREGVDLFVVIANWPRPRQAHWTTLLQARAVENQAYVLGVNRCGADPDIDYAGGSMVVGPRGEVLARAYEGSRVIMADPDLETLTAYRSSFPALNDMRQDGV